MPPQWRPVLAPCDVPEEHGGVHPARGEELAVRAEVERKDRAGVAPQLPGIDRTVRVREVPEEDRPFPGRRREEVADRAKRGGLHFPPVRERFRQAADPGGVADVPEDNPIVIAARGHDRARRVRHHVVDRALVGFLEIGDGDRPAVRLRVAGPGHVPEQDVPCQVARDEEPTAGAERQAEHIRIAALEPGQRLEDFKRLVAVRPVAGHRGNGSLPELADAATGTGAGRRHDPIGAIVDGPWQSVRPPQGAGQGAAGRHVPADHRFVAPGRQQPRAAGFENQGLHVALVGGHRLADLSHLVGSVTSQSLTSVSLLPEARVRVSLPLPGLSWGKARDITGPWWPRSSFVVLPETASIRRIDPPIVPAAISRPSPPGAKVSSETARAG